MIPETIQNFNSWNELYYKRCFCVFSGGCFYPHLDSHLFIDQDSSTYIYYNHSGATAKEP